MRKRGVSLSLNVIIIAVIVLIVLVVMVIIFSQRSSIFAKSTEETAEQFATSRCDIPGTGRYCSSNCLAGDREVNIGDDFTCADTSRGIERCCCCKFTPFEEE